MPDLLLAIDPGRVTGAALFERDPIRAPLLFARQFAVGGRAGWSEVMDLFNEVEQPRGTDGGTWTLAIEAQYQGAGKSFQSIRTLCEIEGFLRHTAEARGWQTASVYPSAWQKMLHMRDCSLRSKQLKLLAQAVVAGRYGAAIARAGEHACDAVCIGMYWLGERMIADAVEKTERRK